MRAAFSCLLSHIISNCVLCLSDAVSHTPSPNKNATPLMSADADLNELIKKFQSLQRSESTKKLNDRHVVEVLNLLQAHLGLDVVFASVGREYLTRPQVRKEVMDEVQLAGGRLDIVDLPNLIQVDILHIERAVKELQEDDPTILVQDGEIITQTYLDSALHEAATSLKESGCVAVSHFAKTHNLSTAFSEKLLGGAIADGRIDASIQDGVVYTAAFVASQRRKMLCALLAVATPTSIADIAKTRDIMPALTQRCAEESMSMHGISSIGRLHMGVYTPNKFEQKRDESVKLHLAANGHISHKKLAESGIVGGRAYMAATFNPPPTEGAATKKGGGAKGRKGFKATAADKNINAIAAANDEYPFAGLALTDGFIADRFFEGLAPAIEGLLDDGTPFLDLSFHIPYFVSLPSQDGEIVAGRLYEHFPRLSDEAILHQNQHLFRKSAVAKALDGVKQGAVCDVNAAIHLVTAALRGAGGDLPEDIVASALQQQVVDVVDANRQAQAVKGQGSKVTLRKQISRECTALGSALSDVSRGLQWATSKLPDAAAIAVHKHVLTTICRPIVAYLLIDEAQEEKELVEWLAANQDGPIPDIPHGRLEAAVKKLPKEKKASLGKLLELTQSSSKDGADVFRETLQDAQSSGDVKILCIPTRNKKAEREAVAAAGSDLLRQLKASPPFNSEKATGPQKAATFALMVAVALFQKEKVVLVIPGKAVTAVVPLLGHEGLSKHLPVATSLVLGKDVPADDINEMEKLRKAVVESD